LDLTLVSRKLWARDAPAREAILAAIDAFKTLPKPLLFHCKSGADRAGFTAAMYLMVCEGRPVADAKKQLGLRYIHLDFTATGVLDYILAVYEARVEQHPIDFEDWIRREYHQKLLQQGFNLRRPLSETLDLIAQSP
jgi:protein tyrosine/serine phosphatase